MNRQITKHHEIIISLHYHNQIWFPGFSRVVWRFDSDVLWTFQSISSGYIRLFFALTKRAKMFTKHWNHIFKQRETNPETKLECDNFANR